MPSLRLEGKLAVVTGGGRGIGAGCALALAGAGAEVVVVSRQRDELGAVVAEIVRRGGHADMAVCDVTDDAAVDDLFDRLTRVDILINNAGTNVPQDFLDVSAPTLDMMLALNVRAAFRVAQVAVRRMMANRPEPERGVIINMSSQLGHVGAPRRTVYCMTKHAIEGFTKALAVELAPHRIRVNAIAPTFVETPLVREILAADPGLRAEALSRIPLGRLGQVGDVMGAAVFLASRAAALITGASLLIDGGWTAR
ncbi:MAG: glucose 1-dehydrogenase [Alphaproteobacteria bacterium]|nr:glucose 1-dehydrogenase [Alphaproteobacteria bacterium]